MTARHAPRGVIRVSGSEAAVYLQGQISQDVESVAGGESAWSLVLDPTGKLVAWFRLWAVDGGFLIDTEPDVVDALAARLERFKLRTDVSFAVETDGHTLESRLDDDVDPETETAFAWPGFHCAERLTADDITPSIDPAYEEARIRAACPRMGVDIDGETIPGEGGQALIDLSVSFSKGCYTGQELVARIDSRGGNVPRPLRVVESEADVAVGAVVVFDGQDVGVLTSAAGPVGLGRILRKAETGSEVTVDGVAARIIEPTGSR
ncbi:MAG: folate-binding protein [Acidimicrobiales bacterium]|nr:MAG: folate-binding protein [Acidimicrobiales bacterium]